MNRNRLLWTAWALVPVGLLAFHYGPGQRASRVEQAASWVAKADAAHCTSFGKKPSPMSRPGSAR